jgi:hypothetical protein
MEEGTNIFDTKTEQEILPATGNIEKNILNEYSLTMSQLASIFEEQAINDESEDEPILLNSSFIVNNGTLDFFTEYTISSSDKLGRASLIISGDVNNNDEGFLSDGTMVNIIADDDIKNRVLEAFEVENELPASIYIKAIIEDALKGKVNIKNMSLQENNLVLSIDND